MNRRQFLVALALAASLASSWAGTSRAQDKPKLTVSAAASFKDALAEINRGFSAARVEANFGASGALRQQIEQGAPVDIFIAAARADIDDLAVKSLIVKATRRDVARNRLVLVTPLSDTHAIRSFRDLALSGVKRVALGTPRSVPAGKYAQQLLQALKIDTAVNPKAVFCKDVRAVLTQVELGNVDAGIVYRTDALISKKVRVITTAPESLHQPIRYPAAVLSASRNQGLARAYLRYLSDAKAQAILRRYGFLKP